MQLVFSSRLGSISLSLSLLASFAFCGTSTPQFNCRLSNLSLHIIVLPICFIFFLLSNVCRSAICCLFLAYVQNSCMGTANQNINQCYFTRSTIVRQRSKWQQLKHKHTHASNSTTTRSVMRAHEKHTFFVVVFLFLLNLIADRFNFVCFNGSQWLWSVDPWMVDCWFTWDLCTDIIMLAI